jgi:hypothetical protein
METTLTSLPTCSHTTTNNNNSNITTMLSIWSIGLMGRQQQLRLMWA